MRTIVCLALLAIVTILGLPLLQEMAVQFGWSDSYEDPMRTISAAADNARSIGNNPDFEYLLAFVGGMTFATLLNAFLGRTEKRRSKSYALLGEREKAGEALKRYLSADPQASLSTLRLRLRYLSEDIWSRTAEGLKLAGLRQ